ncbi:MAG: hypothetical protein R2697_20490 [Ilumatobacteraceae bacterium]
MSGPIPARVDATAKAVLLGLIDDAVDAGWSMSRACAVLELDRGRAWRWQQRRAAGRLDDAPPGGNPIHGLLQWEIDEILAVFDEWADVDRSHRKLAHRGSYEARVWVSPSTVDRVLARHGLVLQGDPRPPRTQKTPWPDWCEWRPNQLWCWDGSQFENCEQAKYAYAIVDLVSRKWIATHLTANPDSVAARILFSRGLHNEQLLTDELRDRLANPDLELPDDDTAVRCHRHLRQRHRDAPPPTPAEFAALARSPSTSAARQPRPTRPGSRRCGATSSANTPTLMTIDDPVVRRRRTQTHPSALQRDPTPQKRSATSPPTTNTKAAAAPSRRPHPRHAHRRRTTPSLARSQR